MKRFVNTYKYSNRDINKFILLLRKGVYSHEYMDDWEIFNGISLPKKEDFYCLMQTTRMRKEFIKILRKRIR